MPANERTISSMSVTVDRMHELRMSHLALANEVRVRCAEYKRSIRGGHRTISEVFAHPPVFLEKMATVELLKSFPKVGRVKALTAMNIAGVPQARLVGGLTERQRLALVEEMVRRGWGS